MRKLNGMERSKKNNLIILIFFLVWEFNKWEGMKLVRVNIHSSLFLPKPQIFIKPKSNSSQI